MSIINQNVPNVPDTILEGGEWYLDDQTILSTNIALHDGEWYINDLEALDVIDTTNNRGEWYLD